MYFKVGFFKAAACVVVAGLFFVCSSSVLFAVETGAPQVARIGYVDFMKALNSVSDGEAVKERLKSEFKEKQVKLDRLQDDLKVLRSEIDLMRADASESEVRAREEVYKTKFFELQQMYSAFKNEMSSRESSLTRQILDKLKEIVTAMGDEGDYSLILEKSQDVVVYAASGVDITSEVIVRYDQGKKGLGR